MSVQAITAAFAVQGVTPSEKLLLLALANYAGSNGECWPSQATLTFDTGLSERTIRTALASIEAAGLLSRERRHRPNGSRTSDHITLTLPAMVAARDEPPTGNSRQTYRQMPPDLPAMVAPPTTFEPSEEPSEEPLEVDARETGVGSNGFDAFWAAYPRKVGKPKAKVAYSAALKRCTGPPAILAGLLPWISAWTDPQFTPHPTTWLNRDGWNDSPLETHERLDHRPPSAADRRRADTDTRRDAWSLAVAECAGLDSGDDERGGSGGPDGNGASHLRLAHATTG